MNITNLTLTQTIKALDEGKFSKEELNKAYHERIKALNEKLNAYLEVSDQDQTGVPAAIKDLIAVKGLQMTCGSKILEGYRPVFDATVIKKLREQGVSFLGKTNLDE